MDFADIGYVFVLRFHIAPNIFLDDWIDSFTLKVSNFLCKPTFKSKKNSEKIQTYSE